MVLKIHVHNIVALHVPVACTTTNGHVPDSDYKY